MQFAIINTSMSTKLNELGIDELSGQCSLTIGKITTTQFGNLTWGTQLRLFGIMKNVFCLKNILPSQNPFGYSDKNYLAFNKLVAMQLENVKSIDCEINHEIIPSTSAWEPSKELLEQVGCTFHWMQYIDAHAQFLLRTSH